MPLSSSIDPRLWAQVQSSYEAKNYKAAILEGCHFLTDLIREKSGLDGDGTGLVGKAFGTKTPIIKITKGETETEKSIQDGTEAMLRGLYLSIRNPRSHGSHSDTQMDCDAIIAFIGYLVTIIDKARSAFSVDILVDGVFDPSFLEDLRYAELLVQEIPSGKKWDVLVKIYRGLEPIAYWRTKNLFEVLLNSLPEADQSEFIRIVSEDLKITKSPRFVAAIHCVLPPSYITRLDERARRRAEGMLIDDVKFGRVDRTTGLVARGSFGLRLRLLTDILYLREQLSGVLSDKLASGDWGQESYVLFHWFRLFIKLRPIPTRRDWETISKALQSGDPRFNTALELFSWFGDEPDQMPADWREKLEIHFQLFAEQPGFGLEPATISDDEVPF